MSKYKPCDCGATHENGSDHADSCMWKVGPDYTFGNREKLQLDERRNAEATGENWMPVEELR